MSENTNATRLVHTNTDIQMKKYKCFQECIIFCYDNADTSSASKMKCENVHIKETICRVENTNMNGNMDEKIQIHK